MGYADARCVTNFCVAETFETLIESSLNILNTTIPLTPYSTISFIRNLRTQMSLFYDRHRPKALHRFRYFSTLLLKNVIYLLINSVQL